jgi:hypothetical protein
MYVYIFHKMSELSKDTVHIALASGKEADQKQMLDKCGTIELGGSNKVSKQGQQGPFRASNFTVAGSSPANRSNHINWQSNL